MGGAKLNEFIFQYATFANAITANSLDPAQSFPNRVTIGQNLNTPQRTEQIKWQFRDDFSWHVAKLGGVGHDFKAGVNFINEPRLFVTLNTGPGGYSDVHGTNNIQPRVGFGYDVKGDGKDVVRAGYGRYYDFSYTNINVLGPAQNANGQGAGTIFAVNDSSGIKNPDGSFFKVSDPISNISAKNE